MTPGFPWCRGAGGLLRHRGHPAVPRLDARLHFDAAAHGLRHAQLQALVRPVRGMRGMRERCHQLARTLLRGAARRWRANHAPRRAFAAAGSTCAHSPPGRRASNSARGGPGRICGITVRHSAAHFEPKSGRHTHKHARALRALLQRQRCACCPKWRCCHHARQQWGTAPTTSLGQLLNEGLCSRDSIVAVEQQGPGEDLMLFPIRVTSDSSYALSDARCIPRAETSVAH